MWNEMKQYFTMYCMTVNLHSLLEQCLASFRAQSRVREGSQTGVKEVTTCQDQHT